MSGNPIPPDKWSYGIDSQLSDIIETKQHTLLANKVIRNTPDSYERKIKNFFRFDFKIIFLIFFNFINHSIMIMIKVMVFLNSNFIGQV